MKMCTLCPRNCAVDRAGGERGICGQTEQLKVARAALHYWEEPCISGESGSGAVFFSGCALHCVFCQNRSIANGTAGKEITKERLAEIFLELQEKGANNQSGDAGTFCTADYGGIAPCKKGRTAASRRLQYEQL